MFTVFNGSENKTIGFLSEDFKESFTALLMEGNSETVLYKMKREFTVEQMEDTMLYLLEFHKKAKDLLNDFWQRTSDACPLEAGEHEKELVAWRKWVYKCLY